MAKAVKQGAGKAGGGKDSEGKKAAPKKVAPKRTTPKNAAPKKITKKSAVTLDKASVSRLEAVSPATGVGAEVLGRLFEVVSSRRGADPAHSHSARLLARGRRKIAQKFGEEAVECLIEAVAGNAKELIGESADVLYHLIVMWVDLGVRPEDVWAELGRREGTSGIAEKASRPHDTLA